jgi:hypothetical protein
MHKAPPGVIATWVFTLLSAALLLVLALKVPDWPFNLLCGLLGALAGAVIALLLSPWGRAEESEFAAYRKALALFLGGYVLGKLDSILGFIGRENIVTELVAKRAMLFAASFLVSAYVVFVSRRYFAFQEVRSDPLTK